MRHSKVFLSYLLILLSLFTSCLNISSPHTSKGGNIQYLVQIKINNTQNFPVDFFEVGTFENNTKKPLLRESEGDNNVILFQISYHPTTEFYMYGVINNKETEIFYFNLAEYENTTQQQELNLYLESHNENILIKK